MNPFCKKYLIPLSQVCLSAVVALWSFGKLTDVLQDMHSPIRESLLYISSDCATKYDVSVTFFLSYEKETILDVTAMPVPFTAIGCKKFDLSFDGIVTSISQAPASAKPYLTTEPGSVLYSRAGKENSGSVKITITGIESEDRAEGARISFDNVPDPPVQLFIRGAISNILKKTNYVDSILRYKIDKTPGCSSSKSCADFHSLNITFNLASGYRLASSTLKDISRGFTAGGEQQVITKETLGALFIDDAEKSRTKESIGVFSGALFATALVLLMEGVFSLGSIFLEQSRSEPARMGGACFRRTGRRKVVRGAGRLPPKDRQ